MVRIMFLSISCSLSLVRFVFLSVSLSLSLIRFSFLDMNCCLSWRKITHSTMTAVSRRTHSRTKHTTAALELLILTQSLPEDEPTWFYSLDLSILHSIQQLKTWKHENACASKWQLSNLCYYVVWWNTFLISLPVSSDDWNLIVFLSVVSSSNFPFVTKSFS